MSPSTAWVKCIHLIGDASGACGQMNVASDYVSRFPSETRMPAHDSRSDRSSRLSRKYPKPIGLLVRCNSLNLNQLYDTGSHCFAAITISYNGKTAQATIADRVRPIPPPTPSSLILARPPSPIAVRRLPHRRPRPLRGALPVLHRRRPRRVPALRHVVVRLRPQRWRDHH